MICLFDQLRITGRVDARLFGPGRVLKQHVVVQNLVVDRGKQYVRDLIRDKITGAGGFNAMNYMAIGTSTTAAAAAQTALVAEIASSRQAVTAANGGASNQVVISNTWAPGENTNSTINEAAIFDASSAGNMMCRAVFPTTINKEGLDTLVVDWTITLG